MKKQKRRSKLRGKSDTVSKPVSLSLRGIESSGSVSVPLLPRTFVSHGNGMINKRKFARLGNGVIFEKNVMVFHPENIEIGSNIYIGHNTILKAYHKNRMIIGSDTWIGQNCFFHSAGGLKIGSGVGIGPGVMIITSTHNAPGKVYPVLFAPIKFEEVILNDGCDIGIGSIILPGVVIGRGSIIGAGSVVTKSVPDFEVWAGVPARKLKRR